MTSESCRVIVAYDAGLAGARRGRTLAASTKACDECRIRCCTIPMHTFRTTDTHHEHRRTMGPLYKESMKLKQMHEIVYGMLTERPRARPSSTETLALV